MSPSLAVHGYECRVACLLHQLGDICGGFELKPEVAVL